MAWPTFRVVLHEVPCQNDYNVLKIINIIRFTSFDPYANLDPKGQDCTTQIKPLCNWDRLQVILGHHWQSAYGILQSRAQLNSIHPKRGVKSVVILPFDGILTGVSMYNPTFGPTSLKRQLRKADFKHYSRLTEPDGLNAIINAASQEARNGLQSMSLKKNNLAGRNIFQVDDLPTELVLRKAAQNLRQIANAKQSSRLDIVCRLKLLCEEGLPFYIARLDIEKFYQSIDQFELKKMVLRRLSTSPSTRLVLEAFINKCAHLDVQGLPPGLSISAALSEFYMQDFDRRVDRCINTHLFARYVDDMIIVLPPSSNIKHVRREITRALPSGLKINARKSSNLCFKENKVAELEVDEKFNYLGFEFKVHKIQNKSNSRPVTMDIAKSKIKMRKTRMVKSMLQYIMDGNFDDLQDRFKIITCNYKFYDHKRNKHRLAGTRHAYGLIDLPSEGLNELDRFQRKLILQTSGRIGAHLAHALSNNEKRELLRLSCTRGFQNKIYFNFSASRLKYLVDCWKYE